MALTNTQYNAIMRNYEKKQIRNRHTTLKRLEEIYTRSIRFKELDDSIATVSCEQGKRLLDGDDTALVSLKNQLKDFKEEKDTLLLGLGYPVDYLEPLYDCKDCSDTGFVNGKKCHCFQQESIDLIYTQSNMKKTVQKENFKNFSFLYYSPKQKDTGTGLTSLAAAKQAVAHSRKFIENFDSEFDNLFFYGDTGVGKTFLSNCIAEELLSNGHSVVYFSAFSLFQVLKKNFFESGSFGSEDYNNIFECDLLIIDDLGTELPNSLTVSQLFLCLNERILRRKSTIISTNLGLNQFMDNYSERIFSRLSSNYTMIKLFGADIRLQKKLNGN